MIALQRSPQVLGTRLALPPGPDTRWSCAAADTDIGAMCALAPAASCPTEQEKSGELSAGWGGSGTDAGAPSTFFELSAFIRILQASSATTSAGTDSTALAPCAGAPPTELLSVHCGRVPSTTQPHAAPFRAPTGAAATLGSRIPASFARAEQFLAARPVAGSGSLGGRSAQPTAAVAATAVSGMAGVGWVILVAPPVFAAGDLRSQQFEPLASPHHHHLPHPHQK